MSVNSRSHSGTKAHSIAVLGLGHVGLPTAVGFSSLGWDVIGADEDAAKISLISAGKAPFLSPDLKTFCRRVLPVADSIQLRRSPKPYVPPRWCSYASARRNGKTEQRTSRR